MNHIENNSAQSLMREVIQRVAVGPDRGRDISAEEAEQVTHAILQGQIDDVQVAVFLIALRMKRESLAECKGVFQALQSDVKQIQTEVDDVICLADPFDGYVRHLPMSPFLPAVLAACGMPALIHGVESVGPKHGVTACKVYKLAGIDVQLTTLQAAELIANLGWAYLDQSQYASSLFKFQSLRDRIVKRTVVTTLERLLMPIRAKAKTHFVLGYVHKAYPQIYAAIAQLAGYDSALLVKGVEGGLTPAINKPMRRYFFDTVDMSGRDFSSETEIAQRKEVLELPQASELNVAAHQIDEQSQANTTRAVEDCLTLGLQVLAGQQGTARESLCLAAGQILWAHSRVDNLQKGVAMAGKSLDSGKAKSLFNV